MSLGNPDIIANKGILPGAAEYIAITTRWAKWQAQNWHSFLEQTYGFVNGIAIAVAMALLASRIKHENVNNNENKTVLQGRWTRALATLSILFGLTYFNVVKNVEEWSGQLDPAVWKQKIIQPDGTETTIPAQWDLPYLGRLPGLDFLHLSPEGWFTLTWILLVIAMVFIVRKQFTAQHREGKKGYQPSRCHIYN